MNDPEHHLRSECRRAYYSDQHAAWVLSRYADVAEALRHPLVGMYGAGPRSLEASHSRTAARAAAPSSRITEWQQALEPTARDLVRPIRVGDTIDIVAMLARPWCRELAARAVGISGANADACDHLAQELFDEMAHATSGKPGPVSLRAAHAMSSLLAPASETPSAQPRHVSSVQMFVAISHSLPGAMASAWLELLRHPERVSQWQNAPLARAPIVDELLRLASPSRALFRVAQAPVAIGNASIGTDQQIILRIDAANRDATVFHDPTQFQLHRHAAPHLALGLGLHHCAGAAIVRMAMACVTSALFAGGDEMDMPMGAPRAYRLDDRVPIAWRGGFAIDHPMALPVIVSGP